MHAEADAEEWDVVLACVACGDYFAFCSAVAEARGDDYAFEVMEFGVDVVVGDAFGVNEFEFGTSVVVCCGVVDGLDYGFVGVREFDVFADEAYSNGFFVFGVFHFVEEGYPVGHVAVVVSWELEFAHSDFVEVLLLHEDGDLVYGVDVDALDYGVLVDVAEERDFFADGFVDVFFGAQYEDVGLDAFFL